MKPILARLLLVVGCCTLFAGPALTASPSSRLDESLLTRANYLKDLTKLDTDLRRADILKKPAAQEKAVDNALRDLAPVVRCPVEYADAVVYVDNRPLQSDLVRFSAVQSDKRKATIDQLLQQVALEEANVTAHSGTLNPMEVERTAHVILRGRDFASDPFPPPTWLEVQMNKLGDEINRWLKKVFGRHASLPEGRINPDVARAILYIIVMGLAAFLFYILYVLLRNYWMSKQATLDGGMLQSGLALNELEAALVSARDYSQLMLMAIENGERGEHRTGFRLVYLATLVLLDTTDNVRMKRSRTNWEYLAAVRETQNARLYELLLPLTQEFDRIWYGFGVASREDFRIAVRQYDSIKSLVVPESGAAPARVRIAQ